MNVKSLLRGAALFAFICGLALNGFSGVKNETTDKNSNKAKAAECKKAAEEFDKQAKEAKNHDIAAALKKCADAKQKLANAYSSNDKKMIEEASSDFNKAQEALKKANADANTSKK